MEKFSIFLVLCMIMHASSVRLIEDQNWAYFSVTKFGAVGDGITDDSQAFMKAWDATCNASSNVVILSIPRKRTFLLKPVNFMGPCKPTSINLRLFGNIIAPSNKSAWDRYDRNSWISFRNVNGLIFNGNGQIDGNGDVWWQNACTFDDTFNITAESSDCTRPTALAFASCNNLLVDGLRHMNSQRNHITIFNCNDTTLSNLHITAPESSPNTDGIDISRSTNVKVHDCIIGTGDDCIAIGGNSYYINISGVACGPGHGISIGSLGANGKSDMVEEIHVRNCSFRGTQNGARIKTWQGGSGYARKISFENIELFAANNPIFIDQFYCPIQNCKNQTSAVKVSDVSFKGVVGTSSSDTSINFSCSQSIGCTNIVLDQINITSTDRKTKTNSFCFDANGRADDTIPYVNFRTCQ